MALKDDPLLTLADDPDTGSLMQRIADGAHARLVPADGAAVLIERAGSLQGAAASGVLSDHLGAVLHAELCLPGQAILRGEVLATDDHAADERVPATLRASTRVRSMICVPLRVGEQPVGVLAVAARDPHAFDAADHAMVRRISDAAAALVSMIDAAHAVRRAFDALEPGGAGAVADPTAAAPEASRVWEVLADMLQPGSAEGMQAARRVAAVLERRSMRVLAQPIVDLRSGSLVGVEALARFLDAPRRGPERWFAEAHRIGLGIELERLAFTQALELVDELPRGALLTVNASERLLAAGELPALLRDVAGERIVLELTEHAVVDDYGALRSTLEVLRAQGVRLAIDDVGAGFSSLRHIVELRPDLVKLDRTFTAGIDEDPARRAVVEAIVGVARETGMRVVAEGIETDRQLETVRRLGIELGQGFRIARPAPLPLLPVHFRRIVARPVRGEETGAVRHAVAAGAAPSPAAAA